MCLLLNHTQSR